MRSGPGARDKAFTRRIPTAFSCCSAASCRTSSGPRRKLLPDFGPSLQFPIGRLPWRDATVSALPGAGGTGQDPDDGPKLWKGTVGRGREVGTLPDGGRRQGNIVETWTQWDKIFKRPHFVTINPYDPEKHVWVVDDHMHAIYKFSHDGKELVQTIGTPTVKGADGTHFNRPTYLAWLPDSTMFVADGYNGTRVAKFDKDGKFLMDWGQKGTPPNDKRPGYFNNVHGIAVDPADPTRVRERPRQPSRSGVRREWQIPLRMEPGRGTVRHSPDLYRRGPHALGFRSRHFQDAQVRSARDISSTPGAPGAISPAASGAYTDSASIRTATSMWLKWITAACRSSGRGRLPTRRSW